MNNLKAKVICAGNCPVCNKPLKDGECIFMCNECKIKNEIFMELEKIKEEIKEYGSIWVQYSIKGHTDKDIDDIVDDVLKQAKQSFIRRLDKHITELKGE